jgi:hypothetical protein
MPRKKSETGAPNSHQADTSAFANSPASSSSKMPQHPGADHSTQAEGTGDGAKCWSRSYKSMLSAPAKGVILGERNGHDWVISFPGDPGQETKTRLRETGFEYRDRKWKVFTHAPNRAAVESLTRELKSQHGEEIAVNDYPTRQVVLAFDAPPGEEITKQLRDAGFHFRSDFTWNADFTPENQKFAREFIQSLPDQSRSASAGR